jgi:putative phosphoribosyl transferase
MMKSTMRNTEIAAEIPLSGVTLKGDLCLPADACGIVVFAHGSGSSRKSSRNRYVAQALQEARLATLLFDLLTEQEERDEQFTRHLRFDMELLATRLAQIPEWLDKQENLRRLKMGFFGASTGAGAAIMAASRLENRIAAIVSRGGRPDLAGNALAQITAPTLLLVGRNDTEVIELNRQALLRMRPGIGSISIIPGASHLFEESGTLERVAALAREWFETHLCR